MCLSSTGALMADFSRLLHMEYQDFLFFYFFKNVDIQVNMAWRLIPHY